MKIPVHKNFFIGFLFILIGLLAIIVSIYYNKTYQVFWFCYAGLIIMGIGVLINNYYVVASQIYILAIPNLVWSIDFFYALINGHSLFGIVDYVFTAGPYLPKILAMQHLISIPLGIYVIKDIKVKDAGSWVLSVFQIVLIYIITKTSTLEEFNINCAYHPCGNFAFGEFYSVVWFAAFFIMIATTYFTIKKIKIRT